MFSSSACCAQRCSSCSSALASNLGTFTNWTSTFQKRLEKSNTKVNYGHYVSVHIRTYRYTLSGHKMSCTSIQNCQSSKKIWRKFWNQLRAARSRAHSLRSCLAASAAASRARSNGWLSATRRKLSRSSWLSCIASQIISNPIKIFQDNQLDQKQSRKSYDIM